MFFVLLANDSDMRLDARLSTCWRRSESWRSGSRVWSRSRYHSAPPMTRSSLCVEGGGGFFWGRDKKMRASRVYLSDAGQEAHFAPLTPSKDICRWQPSHPSTYSCFIARKGALASLLCKVHTIGEAHLDRQAIYVYSRVLRKARTAGEARIGKALSSLRALVQLVVNCLLCSRSDMGLHTLAALHALAVRLRVYRRHQVPSKSMQRICGRRAGGSSPTDRAVFGFILVRVHFSV